ncbi:hypothetical protein [Mucilaginibacter lacusdianchii]|uniref:hypothetical protein n=1 Tax=Mucilaginibacter lacusdianchii TaxID=2684211 RepID=UPI00131CC67A|nr:hypothetical protein [Mucilaginibacter sp. JXJ CY 39]
MNLTPNSSLNLTTQAQAYLKIATKWARFLSIAGFISCGFIIIFGFFAGSFMATMAARLSPTSVELGPTVLTIFSSIILALLYFFPCLYLYKFSARARNGIDFNSDTEIELAMAKLKSFFIFIGALTIIMLCFYAFGFLGFIAGIGTNSSMR